MLSAASALGVYTDAITSSLLNKGSGTGKYLNIIVDSLAPLHLSFIKGVSSIEGAFLLLRGFLELCPLPIARVDKRGVSNLL